MDTDDQKTLGEFLRTERERRGISLEQVSSVTKIGVRVLQALEQDRYSDLPALPFVKGFIKTYCQMLQLNPNQVLSDYDRFLIEKSKSRPNREGGMSGYAFERPEGEQAKRMLWIVMGVMFVFGALVVLVFKPSLKHRKHGSVEKLQISASPSPEPSPSDTLAHLTSGIPQGSPSGTPLPSISPSAVAIVAPAAQPSPSVSPAVAPEVPLVVAPPSPAVPSASPVVVQVTQPPSPSPVALPEALPAPSPTVSVSPSPSPSPSADTTVKDPLQTGVEYPPQEIKHKIVVRALADVWVRYRCDGKKPMRFTLKAGRILVLRGKETVHFQASNPDAVNISAGRQNYRPMSNHPQVFDYQDTSTLVWPDSARAAITQNFPVRDALPDTPDPGLSQGVNGGGNGASGASGAAPGDASEVIPE